MSKKTDRQISEILKHLEIHAPAETAEPWDNVGLLVGDRNNSTAGAVVCIDLTQESIELAKQKGYSLIINHHPCIFPKGHGLSRVTSDSLVFEAVKSGISVISCHTNFDQCGMEVLDWVSKGLGLTPQGRLFDAKSADLLKLVAFVPASHLEEVRKALCAQGAGSIGNYDFCTFGTRGEGTFRGGAETRPWVGQSGKLEKVEEIRLETILPSRLRERVTQALIESHPYEEVAYDFYSVKQQGTGHGLHFGYGYGFWGHFSEPKPFSDVIKNVKSLFNTHGFWVTRPTPGQVTRVGFVAGKGASFVDAALMAKCDLLITGEVGYHNALGGQKRGMAIIELGHRESEKFFAKTMCGWLSEIGMETLTIDTPTQELIVG